jgi:hypothetical protein
VPEFAASSGGAVSQQAMLEQLAKYLPGDYSNDALTRLLNRAGDDQDVLRTHIRPVSLPQFGERVFFVEEYRGRRSTRLERIRLYVLKADADGEGVNMLVLNPKAPEALAGAKDDLSRLNAMTWGDLTQDRPACALRFAAAPTGALVGRMNHRACDFREQWVDYELHVSASQHWVCYSRRSLQDDRVIWQAVVSQPCVLMSREVFE